MKVRLKRQVFIRHVGNESVVVCPRTGGCTVMSDARPFLEQFVSEWREMRDVIASVAKHFACATTDVSEDVYRILGELESQEFAERDTWSERMLVCDSVEDAGESIENENATLFGDFCKRHNLLAELHMDLTDWCNESCVHCYIPKGRANYLPKETAFKVLREFRDMEGLIVFISGGECMLHRDFAEILREAKRLGLNIVVMSNLTLCDEKMVALLKEIDPQFVNVSLYSMKREEHDAITRVAGSWQKTMGAIRALKEAGVHVRLAAPIMRQNKDAAEGLLEFAARENMHCILDCDIIGRLNHDCSNQCHALPLEEVANVIRRHKSLLCHRELEAEQCVADAKVCEIGEGKLNVNARGDFYPCDGGHGIVLGNAATDALADVWKGEKLNALRALKNLDFPKCVGCADRPWCKVCVMRNFNETGDMFTPASERCAFTAVHHKVWEEK